MGLQIDSRAVGEVLVVKCSGRIVAGSETQALHDHLQKAITETPDVVLHLGDVAFIDSSGLGMLVRLMMHARSAGGDLKLCAIPEFVLKILRTTNLATIFETFAAEAEAIAASYQRRQSARSATSQACRRILCLEESADVLAYLRELLRHAGYGVLTARTLPDAKVLLKATRPDLIIVGPQVRSHPDTLPKDVLERIAPAVPTLVLEQDFSTRDPAEAGAHLLEKIQQGLQTDG